MAHDHHHDHGSEYYIEQLFTILVCGALGLTAIQMNLTGKLDYVLAKPFHLPVLIGGIAILVIVALRAVAIWRESGTENLHAHEHHSHDHAHHHDHGHDHAHGHDHDHHHDHDHQHAHGHAHEHTHHHHEHDDHGHSHDLSWTFVRLLILVFPVALYLLGVPNKGYSEDHLKRLLSNEESIGVVGDVKSTGRESKLGFNDLNGAAYDPAKRESLQGDTVELEGRMHRLGDKEFTLFKLKMTCCAADTVPLKVRIVSRESLNTFKDSEWVRVKGQLQFVQVPGSTRYIPVIKATQVEQIPPPPGGDYE